MKYMAWKYIDNHFIVQTNGSFPKTYRISLFHYNRLLGLLNKYPSLDHIFKRYEPLHFAFVTQYEIWKSQKGLQLTKTDFVETLYKQVYNELNDVWDIAIKVNYNASTLRYLEIFPNGKSPFYTGSIDQRIDAFAVLLRNIGNDMKLVAVINAIETQYQRLLNARKIQVQSIGITGDNSKETEKARIAAMDMQYRNTAWVMDNMYEDRENICDLIFDLTTLRRRNQTVFTAKLPAGKTKEVLQNTFATDDTIAVKLTGTGSIKLYLSTDANSLDSKPIALAAKQDTVINVNDFGVVDYNTHRSLVVVNDSGGEVKYRVELL